MSKFEKDNWADKHYKMCEFEIIEDMTQVEAGGFRPGSRISRIEMIRLLADKMLAKGTRVLHIPTGEERHVDYGAKG